VSRSELLISKLLVEKQTGRLVTPTYQFDDRENFNQPILEGKLLKQID
jgi:hypothetical protein